MAKVLFLYVSAGFGHRKVAEAVYKELALRRESGVELEIFDALEKTNFLFRNSYSSLYHWMVMHASWLWGFCFSLTSAPLIYPMISPVRTIWNWFQSFVLRRYLEQGQYDHIIFTHFFPAEVCATLKRKGKIKSNLITIVTDVIPHRVWINPGTDHFWVMAEESAKVLMANGVRQDQIQIKGIPVSTHFLEPVDRAVIRRKLELDEHRLTVLFTGGSFGMGPTEEVLHSFSEIKDKVQAIVVCGQNKILLHTLNSQTFSFPVRLLGFVDNMHELMSASDLMVAKPGGATTCESLIKGLPMIMASPIPGQETQNADWLDSHRAAFKVNHPHKITTIVKHMVHNADSLTLVRNAIKTIAKPNAAKDLADFILKRIHS